ncbi:ArnT family glycosyltransferase [Aquabacterium sp.]|uniref:ArnT family glycosyltransferase n=1 Tax=Aquabacterium sp. TaxID=1872578 RepID=UPI0035B19988
MSDTPLSPASPSKQSAGWALFVLLAGLLTLYRLWAVQHSGISLFFDESQYWDWSRRMDWGYYSKPPMVAAEIWLSTALLGSGVLGVKTLSMLLYPLTAGVLAGLARALWPGEVGVRSGWVAAALFLTMPLVGLLGMVVSTDGPLLLCWALASWALWRAQTQDKPLDWLACGLAVGLGVMSKYTMGAFALTALWVLWAVPGPRKGLWRPGPWMAALAAAVVVAPNIWWNVQNHFPTLQHTADITTKSARSGGIVPAMIFLLGQIAALGPFAVLAAWLAGRGHRSDEESGKTNQGVSTFLLAGSAPLLALAVLQAFKADAHVNWAAPALLGVILILAYRLATAGKAMTRWVGLAVVSNLLLTGAVFHAQELAHGTLPGKFDILVRMRGWQTAYDALAPVRNQDDLARLPVMADSRLILTQTAYHWRQFDVHPMAWNPKGTRLDHYQMTNSMPGTPGQDVLYVTDRMASPSVLDRFQSSQLLRTVQVPIAPDRMLSLRVYVARGFKGYGSASGPAPTPSED